MPTPPAAPPDHAEASPELEARDEELGAEEAAKLRKVCKGLLDGLAGTMPIRFPPIPAEPLAADKVALCDRLQVASCAWYLSPGSSSLGVFRSSSGGSP